MTTTIQKSTARFARILAVYLAVLIIFGIFKLMAFFDYISFEYFLSARVSAVISLFVSSLISIIIIALLCGILCLCNIIFEFEIKNTDLVDCVSCSVYVFILFELIRLVLCFFLLGNELKPLIIDNNIVEQLKNTRWFFYDSILRYVMIFTGSVVFSINMYVTKRYKDVLGVVAISLILLLGLYVSTIDFLTV